MSWQHIEMDEWVNTNLEDVQQVQGNMLTQIAKDLKSEVEKSTQNYWLCNSKMSYRHMI